MRSVVIRRVGVKACRLELSTWCGIVMITCSFDLSAMAFGRRIVEYQSDGSSRNTRTLAKLPKLVQCWVLMSRASLNLQQLSGYLHLPDAKIRKLVDRGVIPSRRVNGELVFSEDDVNRWWEQRIGESDEEELLQVEAALTKSSPPETAEDEFSLASLIPESAIALPLSAKTRDSVIRSMVQLASTTGLLWDADAMAAAVKAREELHTTALDNGVALLHPRSPLPNILGDTFLALGIVPNGVPFGGATGLTDVFFLICSMDDRVHLRILARLSRVLTQSDFLKRLRESSSELEVRELILEFERAISSVG